MNEAKKLPSYRSAAKNALVDMVVALRGKDEAEYVIFVEGGFKTAEKFVHRMRVELSRFRQQLADEGRVSKHFKIYLKEMEKHGDTHTKVTLLKSIHAKQKIVNDVADVFNIFETGEKLSD